MGQRTRRIESSTRSNEHKPWPLRDLLSTMFVSGATALGIAVLVGGGTAGIQTPLAVPAADVNALAASSVEEGRAEPSPLSVRVMKPSRRAPTGEATAVLPLAFAEVVDFEPVADKAQKSRKPARSTVVVDPAPAPPVVLTAAPQSVVTAAPVTKAAPKAAAKAKPPKAEPPPAAPADPGPSGAPGSASGTDRAQTAEKSKKKAKDK